MFAFTNNCTFFWYFVSKVVIGIPSEIQRLEIIKAHTKTLPLGSDVDLSKLAEITIGYVGADLASLCREASLTSVKGALNMNAEKSWPSDYQGK